MAEDCAEDTKVGLLEPRLVVGGVDPPIWYKEAYRNRGESQCTAVFSKGQLYYICHTCALHPDSAICWHCFQHGNHEGHDYKHDVSLHGGFCDCGDPNLWRESGFCSPNPRHPRLYELAGEFQEEHLESTHDCDARFGASSSSLNFSPSTTLCYSSVRTQSMIENKSKFKIDVEFEIEYSKDHWTEVDCAMDTENFGELNRAYFMALMQKYTFISGDNFFKEVDDVVVGKKLGEGGQAEIYEAGEDHVVKVFHPSFRLEDLERQFPPGMLRAFRLFSGRYYSLIQGGILLKDNRFLNRFAIVMERQWGDLRKLIDLRMVEGNNQGPPFSVYQVRSLMFA